MHKKGHVREGFHEEIENYPKLERGKITALWNCTDILPSGYCSLLDIPVGSTYAQAARHLSRIRLI